MTKRGTWRLPFLPNWCVQFWCSSKPGGVMFPPELVELTSFLYSQKLLDAREKLANPPTLSHRAAGVLLLDEKGLAQLIATDKGFHRPIAAEEILDFPVLINLLRRAQFRCRNHLQGIRVHNTVTLEPFRLLVVKHRENHAAGPQ